MFDIAYHLACISNAFCKYFNPDQMPNAEFIRHWLRGYYEEANRLDDIRMNEDEFDQLIEKELKKVLVQMLIIRIVLIQRALLFIFTYPGKISVPATIKYSVDLYEDYLKHRDEHLKLLDELKT